MSSYKLIVLATDGGTPTPRVFNVNVDVTVADINDHKPMFGQHTYVFAILENKGPQVIGHLNVSMQLE